MSSSNIYRQYDIRGIVGQELTDEVMFNIGRAFALYARQHGYRKILLGRDNRISSPHYRDLLTEALLQSGCEVTDLGMVITPMFYYASRHLEIGAGIMITASHNPGEYNGCKLLLGESTIYGDQITAIKQLAEKKDFPAQSRGSLNNHDIRTAYMQMITEKIKLGPYKPKVVVDCGNGSASPFAPQLFTRLGCETIALYCESDPTFPHHHPDPVKPENLLDLIHLVKQTQADIGIGIDGDGDRLGVVDRDGNMIWGDQLMILFWRDILPRYPHLPSIVEVKCSQSLIDEIRRLGGTPLLYKTGHSLIKAKMKETGAIFTGEMSGHMFFADDYYGFDDALYAAARLLLLLSNSKQTISEMLSDTAKYYATPEIRLPSDDKSKFQLVEQVRQHFTKDHEVIDIDGARIIFPHGWGLVRASNTGPEIICRCEGDSPEVLENITSMVFGYLGSLGLKIPQAAF
ncbi:MAG TPA: phosphomannomutase/phosphoglucomutase [Syntrophomonas sp.]|nr:phosphomannomutase/phosphoglucomutase [Syntrophomonas sp.]